MKILALLALAGCTAVPPAGVFIRDVGKTREQRCAEAGDAYEGTGHTLRDGALVVLACM